MTSKCCFKSSLKQCVVWQTLLAYIIRAGVTLTPAMHVVVNEENNCTNMCSFMWTSQSTLKSKPAKGICCMYGCKQDRVCWYVINDIYIRMTLKVNTLDQLMELNSRLLLA